MFNTVENGYTGTSDLITINIHFTSPVTSAQLSTTPFNPFIISQLDRGHEIHMIDKAPTSLMDMSLFNTEDDASKMQKWFTNNL